jgi:hypothetical protein
MQREPQVGRRLLPLFPEVGFDFGAPRLANGAFQAPCVQMRPHEDRSGRKTKEP